MNACDIRKAVTGDPKSYDTIVGMDISSISFLVCDMVTH